MENRITHVLIESMVRKALKDARESPERSVRNLIDVGLNFSTGKYQQHFLEVSRKLLENDDSGYYRLIRNAVRDADTETLVTFGMNVGYGSCTLGADLIRRTEEKEHFNIPWMLTLSVEQENCQNHLRQCRSLIDQGTKLGIYTYAVFIRSLPPDIFSLFAEHQDCAFVLFCSSAEITDDFLEQAKMLHNLCISVEIDSHSPSVCHRLRRNRLIYGVHTFYTAETAPDILNGSFLDNTEDYAPPLVFFIPSLSCPEDTRKKIYDYILECRQSQEYPSVAIDVFHDGLKVDAIISSDPNLILFRTDGVVSTSRGQSYRLPGMDEPDLKTLLKELLPK